MIVVSIVETDGIVKHVTEKQDGEIVEIILFVEMALLQVFAIKEIYI